MMVHIDLMLPAMAAVIIIIAISIVVIATWHWICDCPQYNLTLPCDVATNAPAISFPQYELPKVVMVTGGCGFLGRHLVDVLITQKNVAKIVVFDIVERDFGCDRVVMEVGDLTVSASIETALKKHGVISVLHAASPDPNSTDVQLLEKVNVRGTLNVLAACSRCSVASLVYTSSASVVWAEQGHNGLDETSAPYPRTFRDAYSRTKAEGEQLVIEAGRDRARNECGTGLVTISLRPHAIWGPNDQMISTTIKVRAADNNTRSQEGQHGCKVLSIHTLPPAPGLGAPCAVFLAKCA